MTSSVAQTHPSDPRSVILSAFDAFRAALRHGEWKPFIDHFADDVEFWVPVPGSFSGRNNGKERLREFYEGQSSRLKLDIEDPLSVIADGDSVVIEYAESGTLDGAPFSNRVAISYVVRAEQIVLSREYLGEVG